MFNINSFMSPNIRKQFESLDYISGQAVFLLKLLDYTRFYPEYADEISKYCKEHDNMVFPTERFSDIWGQKDFIIGYAKRVRSMDKVKKLINDLCTDLLDENDNFDLIIDKAQSAYDIVQSIDDFDFVGKTTSAEKTENSSKKADTANKKSLAEIMKYKNLVEPPKPKKEKKKK